MSLHEHQEHKVITLAAGEAARHSVMELTELIENANKVVLRVPCPSIRSANSHLDIASDYIDVLFVGESVAEYCQPATYEIDYSSFPVEAHFHLCPHKTKALAQKLIWLSAIFDDERDLDWDDEEYAEVREEISEFEANLEGRILHFPDLADLYAVNSLAGEYDVDDRLVDELHTIHSERKYGFWRSFVSYKVGFDCYVSQYCWIIPRDQNATLVMQEYGGFESGFPSLELAHLLSIGQLPSVLLSKNNLMTFPEQTVREARECAEAIWLSAPRHRVIREGSFTNADYSGYIEWDDRSEKIADCRVKALLEGNKTEEFLVSFDGDVLMVVDTIAKYIFFSDSLTRLTNHDAQPYLNALGELSVKLASVMGEHLEFSLPWHLLDDEKFEQLCYDVLRCQSRCDPDSLRKMGKSRSRDGGRDIEFQVRQHTLSIPSKWIAQCKLITSGGSLSGTKVNVADTIDQYGAKGFCVMTNALIDSTLHDKLVGIATHRNIEVDEWDKLRMERYLAQRPEIRDRYFNRANTVTLSSFLPK